MLFTNNEIVFFTSVSRGKTPFGVRYRMPEEGGREAFIEETMQSLMQKGILNDKRKLTKKGAMFIRSWELYRNCRKHVIVNRIRAAVLGDGKLITVCRVPDSERGSAGSTDMPGNDAGEYEICCMDSAVLMLSILKQSDYLCLEEKEAERGRWHGISTVQWQEELDGMEGCIPVCEYENAGLTGRKLFYWKSGEGYQLNMERMRIRNISPAYMRRQLYQILGGREDE